MGGGSSRPTVPDEAPASRPAVDVGDYPPRFSLARALKDADMLAGERDDLGALIVIS